MTAEDPVVFVARALETLPRDPANATHRDLERLAAIGQGLAQVIDPVLDHMRWLAEHLDGATPTRAELEDLAWTCAKSHRCERAHVALGAYTAAAVKAHGINLADLVAGG